MQSIQSIQILEPRYDTNTQFQSFWDIKKNSEVSLKRIWINEMPAAYLKRFASYAEKCLENSSQNYENKYNYKLTSKDWTWYSEKIEDVANLTLTGKAHGEDKPWTIEIPLFLTVFGLKVYIAKKLNIKLQDCKTYRIYNGDHELDDDDCILNDYSIRDKSTIMFDISTVDKPKSNEQQSQGKSITASDFNTLASALQSNLGLVCQIITEYSGKEYYGTGFMISKDHIMTNDHVLAKRGEKVIRDKDGNPEIFEGDRAIFFYDSDKENGITIPLEKVIYTSQRPESGHLTPKALDFCIVRLKMNWKARYRLHSLNNVSKTFFPTKSTNKPKTESTNKPLRANIIQHPIKLMEDLTVSKQPKQIDFRENQVSHIAPCELHYKTNTGEGSSGSPVLDDLGAFIALHRSSCGWLEQKLRLKSSELQKEIQMFFASRKPRYTLNIKPFSDGIEFHVSDVGSHGIHKSSALEFIEEMFLHFPEEFLKNDTYSKLKNFACAEFSQLIQEKSDDLSDLNLGNILQEKEKSKLWACQFLRRLSGEITEENMERTLRIKIIELRDKLIADFKINKKLTKNKTILLIIHNQEEDTVIWEINNETKGTSIISLLEHIQKNFKNIFKSDNVLAYAQKFLKQDEENRLDDAPEKHIYCNTAILATKIFENLSDNSAYDKIKKSQEEKEWSYPVIIGGALAVVTVVGSLYWFRDNIKELFNQAPNLRQKFFRQAGVY